MPPHRNDTIGDDAWKEERNRLMAAINISKRLIVDLESIDVEVRRAKNAHDCNIARDQFQATVEQLNDGLKSLFEDPGDPVKSLFQGHDQKWMQAVVEEFTEAIIGKYDISEK